jgi:hypothetical protein
MLELGNSEAKSELDVLVIFHSAIHSVLAVSP